MPDEPSCDARAWQVVLTDVREHGGGRLDEAVVLDAVEARVASVRGESLEAAGGRAFER